MGFVHQEHAVVFLFELNDPGQVRDIAVHAEQAFGNDDRVFVLVAMGFKHLLQGIAVIVGVGVTRRAGKARALNQGIVGQAVVKNGIARAEHEAQGGDVGRVPADVDDAVLHLIQVGQSALQVVVGRTLAAHQAAGPGRSAEKAGRFGHGFGDFGMGIDVQIIVGGKIDEFFAVDQRGGFGRPIVANKERIIHPHLAGHFHKPLEGELGTHAVEAGSAALWRNGALFRRCGAGLTGMVVLHALSSRIVRNLPDQGPA